MKLFSLMFLAFVISGCSSNQEVLSENNKIIIDQTQFLHSKSSEFTIKKVELTNDLLKIEYSGGGFDGKTWKVNLIASEYIAESLPPIANLKFILLEEENAEKLISKTAVFDIKNLKLFFSNEKLLLNIKDWEKKLLY